MGPLPSCSWPAILDPTSFLSFFYFLFFYFILFFFPHFLSLPSVFLPYQVSLDYWGILAF